jgi:hypothetical protein
MEAYGLRRRLGELALALRQETYRPDPIRRVYIPEANGKLRPLGMSTLRDRVCMTAAMLVLESIFEADLPPEQYAYRPGQMPSGRWSRWTRCCFAATRKSCRLPSVARFCAAATTAQKSRKKNALCAYGRSSHSGSLRMSS